MIHCFSPKKWEKATDLMILKKANVFILQKMRTICLLNAEFNINNQWVGRLCMQKAESDLLLASEQYGSRKHKDASTAALNKKLAFDYLRLMRKPGILIFNDASKCYDRIVHSFAILAMLRTGLLYETAKSLFLPIQKMEHKIATGYGVSTTTYKANAAPVPLQGILQDNGNGHSGWAMISSPQFDFL